MLPITKPRPVAPESSHRLPLVALLRVTALASVLAVTAGCGGGGGSDSGGNTNDGTADSGGGTNKGDGSTGDSPNGDGTNGGGDSGKGGGGDGTGDDDNTGDGSDGDNNAGSGDDDSSVSVGITFTPAHRESGVILSRTVTFEADQALDPGSIDGGSFTLSGPDGNVEADVDFSDGIARLNPVDKLQPNTAYTATVTTDVLTADGDPIADSHHANFTTVKASALPPKIELWEQQMVEYGNQWGQALQNESNYTTKLNMQYYDAQRVYEQIADYVGETWPWRGYANAGEDVYKRYIESNDFRTGGWMRFTRGLYLDWKVNGDSESHEYLEYLRDEPPFSYPTGWEDKWSSQVYSREVAYSIESHMDAERAGYPRQGDRLRKLVNLALGHIDIWVTESGQYCQAFMAGLTSTALIDYYERSVEIGDPDTRILPAVKRMAEFLWDEMWVANVNGSGYGAFEHVQPSISGTGSESPAPDLSLLIAPMYSWLYLQTGDATWLERGDQAFAGGVEMASVSWGSKQFNQNYRDSFNFVEWRAEAVEKHGAR